MSKTYKEMEKEIKDFEMIAIALGMYIYEGYTCREIVEYLDSDYFTIWDILKKYS